MKQLLFVTNELMLDEVQEKYNLPMTFVGFAYANGIMYNFGKKYKFYSKEILQRQSKNDRIYGVLVVLDKAEVFIRVLDGIMGCSKSSLSKNHALDLAHREQIYATPIHFDLIEDFFKMNYKCGEKVKCYAYFSNPTHKDNKVPLRAKEKVDFNVDCFIDKLLQYENEKEKRL